MIPFVRVVPPERLPHSIRVPGSKSVSHRALILASHCHQAPDLPGLLDSADTDATRRGIASLRGGRPIDCGNSGTSLRLLMGQAALRDQTSHFLGDESLSKRSSAALIQSLERRGVRSESRLGCLPITLKGPLRPGHFSLDARLSSQFLSSLLLALPFAPDQSEVHLTGPVPSQAYVDLTLEVTDDFGLVIDRIDDGFRIPGSQQAKLDTFSVEGDWSAAGLAAAFAVAVNQPLQLLNLRRDSRQPDRRLADFVELFGAKCHWQHDRFCIEPGPRRQVLELDLRSQPDLFPPMAVLASLSPGPTTLRCSPGIRHKECDRLAVMSEALRGCGIETREDGDDLTVVGGQAKGGTITCHGDHRIYMALCALSATVPEGLQLDGVDTVRISWPNFHEALDLTLS